jgi:hypothetical protein
MSEENPMPHSDSAAHSIDVPNADTPHSMPWDDPDTEGKPSMALHSEPLDNSYAADVDDSESLAPKPIDLATIVALANEQLRMQNRVAWLTNKLAEETELLRGIAEKKLPEALELAGMKDFTLADGSKVQVAEKVVANISKENQLDAHTWLRNEKHGDIIKHVITTSFGAGADKVAKALLAELRARPELKDETIEEKEAVHPQTLLAFVKRQIAKAEEAEAEVNLPNSITVLKLKFAKITVPKQKAPNAF